MVLARTATHGASVSGSWSEIVKGFADPIESSKVEPDPGAVKVYDDLIEAFSGAGTCGVVYQEPRVSRSTSTERRGDKTEQGQQ